MRKSLVGIIFGWLCSFMLGFMGGAAQLKHDVVRDCDRNMRIAINGDEYTCMKVPKDGLAQNMKQLSKKYQLTHWTKDVREEK